MENIKNTLKKVKNWFFALSWWKKTAVVIIAIIIIVIILQRISPKKPQYQATKVTIGTVTQIVSETGNAQAAASFPVYSPATGYITDVYVKNGDTVALNQPLFKVQSTATDQEKSTALSNLLAAQATLGTAQATMYSTQSTMYKDWNTYYNLATNSTYQNSDGSPDISNRALPEFTTAQDNWLSAEASYKNQQTVVNQAQAALNSAKLAYNATQNATVNAPSAGTVANMTAVSGQEVTAFSATSTANTPELIVGNFSQNIVVVSINEVDINQIKAGQRVDLVFDANRAKTYTGHVERIDDVGTNTNGVVNYNVYVSIDNADSQIKPGMTVTASIETARHENVLIVPNSAIVPYKGAKAVLVPGASTVNGKKLPFHYVPVTIGLKGITETEITSGVTNNEAIVTNTGTLLQ